MSKFLSKFGFYILFLIALVATSGSLYFSEVMLFIPCKLCWYQRILMYPLVIIFCVSMFRKEKSILYYTLPISILGFCIGLFHYLKQKVAFIQDLTSNACGQFEVSCDGIYINWFGFITIPFLSLTAFLLITIVTIIMIKSKK